MGAEGRAGQGVASKLGAVRLPGGVREVTGSLPPGVWELHTPEPCITLLAKAAPIN